MCNAADIVVGYRNFCSGDNGRLSPTFVPVSYLSDPVEAFRLPPLSRGSKPIAAFSMVKNCKVRCPVCCHGDDDGADVHAEFRRPVSPCVCLCIGVL